MDTANPKMAAPRKEESPDRRGFESSSQRIGFSAASIVAALIAIVVVAALGAVAEIQRPSVDRFAVRTGPTTLQWWIEPVEVNPHLRRPAMHAALNAVTFNDDGKRGWAVGDGGTILRTTNGGDDWERVVWDASPADAPQKRSALDWEWVGSAHAAAEGGPPSPSNPAVQSQSVPNRRLETQQRAPSIDGASKQTQSPNAARQAIPQAQAVSPSAKPGAEQVPSAAREPTSQGQTVSPPASTVVQQAPNPVPESEEPVSPSTTETVAKPTNTPTPNAQQRAPAKTTPESKSQAPANAGPAQSASTKAASTPPAKPPEQAVPQRPTFNAVFFLKDGMQGWVAGTNGTILVTRDAGAHWQKQNSGTVRDLRALAGTDDGRWLIAAGRDGVVLSSVDGGTTWQSTLFADVGPVSPGLARSLNAVAVVDTDRAVIVGDRGFLRSTTDGGKSWQDAIPHAPSDLYGVAMSRDGRRGLAVGGGSADGGLFANSGMLRSHIILSTEDGWKSWQTRREDEFSSSLHSVILSSDGNRAIAVGNGGILTTTSDAGATWSKPVNVASSALVSITSISDGRRIWAVGDRGTIATSDNGGATWKTQGTSPQEFLSDIAVSADGRTAIAVGDGGFVLASDDRGISWKPRRSGLENRFSAIALASDGRRGFAVGEKSIVVTQDGGETWQAQPARSGEYLSGIAVSADGQQAIVAGIPNSLRTTNGGATWQITGDQLLFSVFLSPDGRTAWATTPLGDALTSRDGGSRWTPAARLGSPTPPNRLVTLLSIVFDPQLRHGYAVAPAAFEATSSIWSTTDAGTTWRERKVDGLFTRVAISNGGQRAWAVGTSGAIVSTEDGGGTWRAQKSSAKGSLASVAATPDGSLVLAVGEGGTIVATQDGGKTWVPATYSRYPAPWFYLAAALCLGSVVCFSVWERRKVRAKQIVASIIDKADTDEPITRVDEDRLGFAPLALGLASYLRNQATTPPLTIAVSAPWGRGKSSVMRMLQSEMQRVGVQSVWFNAWHHQKEDVMLASLLESIRAQALPFWLTWRGLRFRFRLLARRIRARPVLSLVAFSILVMPIVHLLVAIQQWIGGKPAVVRDQPYRWAAYIADSIAQYWNFIDYANPAQKALIDKLADGKVIEFATGALGSVVGKPEVLLDVIGYGLLAGAVFALFAYGFRAFPGSPAVLLASLSDRFKIRDAEAQASYRQQFKQHFKDVCEALRPRTMLIFIDDLDRCSPAKTAEMLEAVNYLVSSGPCYVVLGMARDVVEAQLAFQYKDLADVYKLLAQAAKDEETPPQQAAPVNAEWQRLSYVKSYLRKLINLEVRVPRLNGDQIAALLELEKQSETLKGHWHRRVALLRPVLSRWARPAFAWMLILAAVAAVMVEVTAGLEQWNADRVKQVKLDRDAAEKQIARMHELERQTLVAVDYARGREKRLATELFHHFGIAVAGLEFRLPIESLKSSAVLPSDLCADEEKSTASATVMSTGASAESAKATPVNATSPPVGPSRELRCWEQQAKVTREVEARLQEVREALEAAAAAKRRDAFGRINDESTRALAATNAALASAGIASPSSSATSGGQSPGATAAGDAKPPTLESTEVIDYRAAPNHWFTWGVISVVLLISSIFVFKREPYVLKDDPEFVEALKVWYQLLADDTDMSVPREIKRFQNRARYYAMRLRDPQRKIVWLDRLLDWLDGNPTETVPRLRTSIPEENVVALTAIHQVSPEVLESGELWEVRSSRDGDSRSDVGKVLKLVAEHDELAGNRRGAHPFAPFPDTRASIQAFLDIVQEDRIDEPAPPSSPKADEPKVVAPS